MPVNFTVVELQGRVEGEKDQGAARPTQQQWEHMTEVQVQS